MARRPKVSRTVPARRRAGLLQPRDVEVLEFLSAVRYALPRQVLLAVGIPSLDATRRLLRRLFDQRLVVAHVLDSRHPNLASLSREGAETLKRERTDAAVRIRPTGPIKVADVPRHLRLTDARLWAAAFLADRGTPLLRWLTTTTDGRYGLVGVQPDAVLEFAVPGGVAAVAVEADARTTAADSIVRRLSAYRRVADAGRLDALWIATSSNNARVEAVEGRLKEFGLDAWARVLPLDVLLR